MDKSSVSVYRFNGALYFNITNECPNACVFCIKNKWNMQFMGFNLKLDEKPEADSIIAQMREQYRAEPFASAVFCGYGESTCRFLDMMKIARAAKELGVRLRLNTIGLGNLVNGRDITPELAEVFDAVNVSLNACSEEKWKKLVRPAKKYEKDGFRSVLEFIKLCAAKIPDTTVSAVADTHADCRKIEETARSLGAKFRLRPHLDQEGK
ncbi:MAG: TatD family nuclease-associated radical SAM protein [Elusimicrobiaceae bacterium]